ncbi:MAG TPA: hypothetical protein VJ774_01825 [Actinomycetota bacterium]|nr:hypothetical protein [Actinomycetota bacterium]
MDGSTVLRLPDFDRAERIGEFCGHPETRTLGELPNRPEEGRTTWQREFTSTWRRTCGRGGDLGLLREIKRDGQPGNDTCCCPGIRYPGIARISSGTFGATEIRF